MFRKPILLVVLSLVSLLPLGACANSPWARNLERSLAADPRLTNNPLGATPTPTPTPTTAQLPANFPGEIPRYPNAEFVAVKQPTQSTASIATNPTTETQWSTPDSAEQVLRFYREQLQSGDWRIVASTGTNSASPTPVSPIAISPTPTSPTPTTSTPVSPTPASPTPASPTPISPTSSPVVTSTATQPVITSPIAAERDGLRVTIALNNATNDTGNSSANTTTPLATNAVPNAVPSAVNSASGKTLFTIAYQFDADATASRSPTATATSPSSSSANGQSTHTTTVFTDLNQAPTELRQYVTDLAQLGVLEIRATPAKTNNNAAATPEFKPLQPITRREYARWLVAANNRIYVNQSARQIRAGVATDQPAFQDVSSSDPDFGAIQGLAIAGLIPSSLTGNATTVTFRPDAALTREEMLLWKVPVDLRRALPNASLDAVQQTWGFQDAARIEPRALRAVLADYQNGDLSNIRRAFGYTTLLNPKKSVTRAEAAAALWYFGYQEDGLSARDALEPRSQQ